MATGLVARTVYRSAVTNVVWNEIETIFSIKFYKALKIKELLYVLIIILAFNQNLKKKTFYA